LSRRGYEISHDESAGRIAIVGHGGALKLRLAERVKVTVEKKKRKDGTVEEERRVEATGLLRLALEPTWGSTIQIDELPDDPLESRGHDIFAAVRKLVIRCRQSTRESDARDRKSEEERRARIELKEARRRRAERVVTYRQRIKSLVKEAEAWERAATVRRYVLHLRSKAAGEVPGAPTVAWLEWAVGVADQLDPSPNAPESAASGY
jgi:hypothetical protein